MQNENNIEALKSQLQALGFRNGLEAELRANICFQPDGFQLRYRQEREGDLLKFVLYLKRTGGSMEYTCSYYEATLRRKIDIPARIAVGVDSKDLEARMSRMEWKSALSAVGQEGEGGWEGRGWERAEVIEGIVMDLKSLAATPEGAVVADLLMLKFWADTPLEGYIENLASLKSGLEISQRFYFFDGEAPITLEEAYRFLCLRWREKQLAAQRKGQVVAGQKDSGNKAGSGKDRKPVLRKAGAKGTRG